ncbi:Replicative DNA helicase [Gimesia alba]|uniref:Replicative DNA helicase n=1 Tax=Gimesia alba TaxID=2527973 RepID=A0A517RKC9_9PLAN|nr:AAA family ATPase [Gimesia alba]QDT44282.1 Replicative DNA helicase [Gimesia alba]
MISKTSEELAQPGKMENYAVGCLLIDPKCRDEVSELTVDHFYSDRNRTILMSIDRLRKNRIPIDTGTIAEDLANQGNLSQIGGVPYLIALMESAPQTAHYSHYAKRVIDRRWRADLSRKLLQAGESLNSGEDLDKVLCELNLSSEVQGKKRFEFLTSTELIKSNFKHEYLINGVLLKGQPCIIAGPKKCLKTNILIALAVSLATGQPFLGKFYVEKNGNVGVMSGESGPATIQETFLRISKSMGCPPDQIEGIHFCFELPAIENEPDLLHIRRTIEYKNLDVLIIDPAYLCLSLGDGASNLFSVGEKLKLLSRLGQETGCTIILVHHTRKSNGRNEFSEPQLEEIAFAGFQEWARQWILLNRREEYRPDNAGIHKLHFVAGGSAGHSQGWALDINEGSIDNEGGRVWETRLFASQQARAEKRASKEQDKHRAKKEQLESDINKVFIALEKLGKPSPASTIRDKAKLSTQRTNTALLELEESKSIESTFKKAGNGRSCEHYSLSTVMAGRNGTQRDNEISLSSEHHGGIGPPYKGDRPVAVHVSESACKQRDIHELVDSKEEKVITNRF